MAMQQSQHQHYIPQFILKQFAFKTIANKNECIRDGDLYTYDVPSGQVTTGKVRKSCGRQNLYYYKADETDPMKIERLFSNLEHSTSHIFRKIRDAVEKGFNHIDIREREIHTLFKFMNISLRRSEQFRDDIKNPYRENDFMFQRFFDASRKSGKSDDPGEFWLDQLLYLLETSHEDLLANADQTSDELSCVSARTYKRFVETYALQIWKAADGYEFFLNESLVDFEGDTESFLGMEEKYTGPKLTWVTMNDIIHLILPISPSIAGIFCDESQC